VATVTGTSEQITSNTTTAYTATNYNGDPTFSLINASSGQGESRWSVSNNLKTLLSVDSITGTSTTNLTTEGPWLDVRAYGATGLATAWTGTIAPSAKTLTTTAASDFVIGAGIDVIHAGAATALTTPSTPTVTPTNVTSASQCQYQIAALDGDGGETAASTITNAADCGDRGAATNNVITAYDLLQWDGIAGAARYAV